MEDSRVGTNLGIYTVANEPVVNSTAGLLILCKPGVDC
jgi:hypothetical protein